MKPPEPKPDPEPAKAKPATEEEKLHAWRVLQANLLGFEWADAVRVADERLDIHKLADLIDSGCPPLTALEILS